MHQAEILIAGLLIAVAGLSALARRLSIPYPIALVLGGAVLGFIPGIPTVKLDPNTVLVVFLPLLVYGAAFFANLGDIRANLRSVTLVSIGLVLVTMSAVAVVAHALIPGLSWPAAFTLGAVVSPTDPLAGASIMRRLEFPRFLVSAIEAEGLFNDATALVAYKVAVAAVVGASFSVADAGLKFIADAVGGVAIGLAVGWLIAEIRARTDDIPTSITISLFSGYAAFIPANAVGASGVLAAVTTGIYMGVRGPSIISARTRLQGFFVWEILDFVLNASLFVLVGLQLRGVVTNLDGNSAGSLALYAAAVSGVVIVTRLDLVLHHSVPDPRDRPAAEPARAQGRSRPPAGDRVEWHEGRGVAGGGARDPAHDPLRARLPGPQPDHLPDVRGDLRDARAPRPVAAGADPLGTRGA